MAKTVLIPQTTFTATEQSISGSLSKPIGNVNFDEETIKVVFDGVTYSVNRKLDESNPDDTFYYYGEDIDNSTEVPTLLFNQYPFRLEIKVYPIATMDVIYVRNISPEHTIEVYIEDTPSVTVQKPGVQVLQLDERLIIFDETTGDIVTFDGENWLLGNDGFGESVMPSKYAVVGTAIVGKDVVAPSEEPEPEPEDEYQVLVIPQQTFTPENQGAATPLQNSTLEDGTTPLKVIFDGETYIVNYNEESHDYGASGYDFSEYPFSISITPFGKFIVVGDLNEHTVEAYVKANDGDSN